ncbi:MAG TPA: hypothetical protein VK674_03885 [Candidatus Limnocylindria bacterium]|nr:hypothetical protein [Candidatus Limnocylindria bacterium]
MSKNDFKFKPARRSLFDAQGFSATGLIFDLVAKITRVKRSWEAKSERRAGLRLNHDSQGIILITVLLVCLLLTFIGLSLADLTIAQHARTTRNVSVSNSLLTAEAGVEQSLHELNENTNFAGFAETVFFNSAIQGRGTYQSVVSAGSGPNEKIITTTGRVYRHNQTTNPISERKIRVTVVGTSSSGYSVYTGPGGLILGGSANITNSQVAVNGNISMSGSARIGTSSQPLTVNVAHQACPTGSSPGPTYPQVCSSGQPISMSGSSRIYGSVCATNQTTSDFGSADILPGSGGQGLIAGCVAPPVTMPTYDRAAHIAGMTTTSSASNPTYACGGSDTKTWPANLRLNGNVSIGGSCRLTINGNVYVTGTFSIGGSARITVANGVGTNRPIILADGNVTLGGSGTLVPNSSGTSVHLISWRSTASCNPNCASVTGTDLRNSQNTTTVDIGGSGNSPGAVFQAYWGRLVLGGSGTTGAGIGQTIDLSGSGTIVFGTTLASGESVWTIRSYQQDFD